MRRDPDTVVKILKDIADSKFNHLEAKLALANGPLFKGSETDSGKANQVRSEHIRWMLDAGLLTPLGGHYVRITSHGMDFLENAENEGVWNETKKIVSETGGSVALELIRELASAVAKKQLKKLGDIEL